MAKRVSIIMAIAIAIGLTGCAPSTDHAMAKCTNYMYVTAIGEYKNPPDQATKDGWAEWAPGVCEESLEDLGEAEFLRLWG